MKKCDKNCNIVEKVKACPNAELNMLLLIVFLVGVIIGFLASPIKSGVTLASNNTIIGGDDDDDEDDED